jgi:hypothetical protein
LAIAVFLASSVLWMCGITPEPKAMPIVEVRENIQGTGKRGAPTAARNGGLDEAVQLLITANGQLQVARGNTLGLEVLAGVARQLQHLGMVERNSNWSEAVPPPLPAALQSCSRAKGQPHLGGEVLKDGSAVNGSGGTNAANGHGAVLEVTVDAADRELPSRARARC